MTRAMAIRVVVGLAAFLFAVAGVPPQNAVVSVPNTAALRKLSTTAAYGGVVWRMTDGAAQAPPLEYVPGTGACPAPGDDGASCVASSDGKSWIPATISQRAGTPGGVSGATGPLDIRQFGASFAGLSTSEATNATALQAAFNWLSKSNSLRIPCGVAWFNAPLSIPAGNYYSLIGEGACSILYYDGPATSDIILTGGPLGGSQQSGWVTIRKFVIASNVKMTAGAALHVYHTVGSTIDPILSTQNGNGNLWNGVWMDEDDVNRMPDVQLYGAQNDLLILNGSKATSELSGVSITGTALTATITLGTPNNGDYIYFAGCAATPPCATLSGVSISGGTSLTATLSAAPAAAPVGGAANTTTESWFPGYAAELRAGQGKIAGTNSQYAGCSTTSHSCPNWPLHGIHLAGGVGGAAIDKVDIIANQTNILVDNAVTNTANQGTVFGAGTWSDVSSADGVVLNDVANPVIFQGGGKSVRFDGGLESSGGVAANASANCLHVKKFTNGYVQVNSFHVTNCNGNGILVEDATAQVMVGATTRFYDNHGAAGTYNIASSVTSPQIGIAAGATFFQSWNSSTPDPLAFDSNTLTSTLGMWAGPFQMASPLYLQFCTGAIPSTCANAGITYSVQSSNYVLDGSFVTVTWQMLLTSKGTSTGNAILNGFPIGESVAGGNGGYGHIAYFLPFGAGLVGAPIATMASGGAALAALYQFGAAGMTDIADTAFANNSSLSGQVRYLRP